MMKKQIPANAVMASDRLSSKLLVFDPDLLKEGDPLEAGEIFSVTLGAPYGSADHKLRENSPFGDVLIVTGWNFAQILSWPEGKSLWFTAQTGNNPHSVEILPSGNLVVACSTGCCLRLYQTSALLAGDEAGAQQYTDYPLPEAHGLLYDPENALLWALGENELEAYRIEGTGPQERLVKDPGRSALLPEGAGCGHDLSADFTDSRYLYFTANGGVYRFCKQTRAVDRDYPVQPLVDQTFMKGLSNNPQGTFFYTRSNGGKGTFWEGERFACWSTERIHLCRPLPDGTYRDEEYISRNAYVFYKSRAFWGRYC